jgi:hypothetical protein
MGGRWRCPIRGVALLRRAERDGPALRYTCDVHLARRGTPACIVSAVLALGACGGARAAPTSDNRATTVAQSEPASPRPCRNLRVAASEPAGQLVPDTPSAMLLCRYAGIGIGRQDITSSYVRRAPVIARLTREFNELPPLPARWASFKCPNDYGSRVEVVLTYAHRRPLLVGVSLSGCPMAARGKIRRWALGPTWEPLLTDLEKLTSVRGA